MNTTSETSEREAQATCEKHGPYTATILTYKMGAKDHEIQSGCTECHEERRLASEAREAARAERQRASWRASRMKAAGFTARSGSYTFDTFKASTPEQERALSVARSFADSFKEVAATGACLTFCGGVGTGKTHLAFAIANQLFEAKRTVMYTTVLDMIRAIRDTWNRDSEQSELDVVSRYRGADLLILDEIGVSFRSEAERVEVSGVIDARYAEMRPTIVISNLCLEEIPPVIGERAYDRLMQNGGSVVVFDWQTWRPSAPVFKKSESWDNASNPKPLSVSERTRILREGS